MPTPPDPTQVRGDELRAYSEAVVEYAKVEFLRGKSGEEIQHELLERGHPSTVKFMISNARQRAEFHRLGITEGDKRMLTYLSLASGITAVMIGSLLIPVEWGLIPRIMIVVSLAIGISFGTKKLAFMMFEKRTALARRNEN
ncbi:MAG: hypothetical protein ACOCX1_01010 [Fimbriimonadaceae bacterium]